jgi:hypothetical protein
LKTAPRGEDFNSLKSRSMDCSMAICTLQQET